MKLYKNSTYQRFFEILLIIVIAAVTYLPSITRASIYRDDWYYAMDRLISGPGVFQEMFKIDRPARGPLFEAYFHLFNVEPLPYHLSSFFWRVAGGISAYLLFKYLWPSQRKAALFMGLLFTLFPGYSRWLEGFENQPRIISSFLEALSILLTLHAIKSTRMISRVVSWTFSIITGWMYIAFVDFSFGMEFFRLLCIFILISHDAPKINFLKRAFTAIRTWLIAALIPAGFLLWRIFIFKNERPTTDINLQLSYLFDNPLYTGLIWLIHLFQSTVNVTILAWWMPTAQSLYNYRPSEIVKTIAFATLAVILLIIYENFLSSNQNTISTDTNEISQSWQFEAIIIGTLGSVAGLLPVIMANRYATLGNYSHYLLPASLASVSIISGFIFAITNSKVRIGAMSILVFLAVTTHHVIALRIIGETTTISNFWHQVVWRAPNIKAGTTLVVNYPGINFGQDIDTISGPANYLYYPNQTSQIPAIYQLSALEQGDSVSQDILSDPEKTYVFNYRTHSSQVNYSKLLVMTQPTDSSCVHILNPNTLELSASDPGYIISIAHLSKIDNIEMDATPPAPVATIFGPEPAHGWCYYYQKAELYLQNKQWEKVESLGNEVLEKDLHPAEAIEWMPFLKAYSIQGKHDLLVRIAKDFKHDRNSSAQVCQALNAIQEYQLSPQVSAEILRLFCTE